MLSSQQTDVSHFGIPAGLLRWLPRVRAALQPYTLAVLLAVFSMAVAGAVAVEFGMPLRDPDGGAGPAYVRLPAIVLVFVLADVIPRAVRSGDTFWHILRTRYPRERVALIAVGLTTFYVTYAAYRNLKGALPLARPDALDEQLLQLDRLMAMGQNPAVLLHSILGTGFAAHILSAVYLLYLAVVPASLGAALVWCRSVRVTSFYVTALCLNWLLGAASYYLVPSLGPVFVRPYLFADLPRTGVSALQETLETSRLAVLADPSGTDTIASVAGFASLHVSVVFTAALIAHRIALPRLVRWSAWFFLGATIIATSYFGWHYLIDAWAGLALGAAAVVIAERATRHVGSDRSLTRPAESDTLERVPA